MYQLGICEDDPRQQEYLIGLCHVILTEMKVEHTITAFSSAEELEESLLKQSAYDLLLLDIMMEGKTGMELAKELRRRDDRVSIIFISGAEEYLSEGYSVQPINFLIKPVSEQKLREALSADRQINHVSKNVTLRKEGKGIVINWTDIWCVEARDHDVVVSTTDETIQSKGSLSEMERILPEKTFCRCHRSYLVNMTYIREITRTCMKLRNNREIPIGRRYYEEAQHKFIEYLNL